MGRGFRPLRGRDEGLAAMKFLDAILDIWRPPGAFLTVDALAEAYEEGLRDGMESVASAARAENMEMVEALFDALERHYSEAPMKKRWRRGFREAADLAYEVLDGFREEPESLGGAFWTATHSWTDDAGCTICDEWNSFDAEDRP